MKIEAFQAGEWVQQYQYRSFSPAPVNHEWVWEDGRLNVLLERANHALGRLDAFSQSVPDVDLFIQMHVTKEAQTSSRIEGTRTEIDEVLMPEEAVDPEKRDDRTEVINYIAAMNHAVGELEHLPVSNRLLCNTHAILMQGVRGKTKNPGEIRRAQNWIGGTGPYDAAFVPPHPDTVPDLMSDLESFLHNEHIAVPDLIRAAIAHYQFETIHPFNDGNGRIGRLLIPLYLISRERLGKPSLYLSDFFNRHRSEYIDALMRVRTANDLNHWVRFFLAGIIETAERGQGTFRQIIALRAEAEAACIGLGRRAANARQLLLHLYSNPFVSARDVERLLGVSTPTANAVIGDLCDINVLVPTGSQRRGRLFFFARYLTVFLA